MASKNGNVDYQHVRDTENRIKEIIRADRSLGSVSNTRSLSYLCILTGVTLCSLWWASTYHPIALVFAFFAIGVAQYHFSVAIHEASHFNLLTPRWLNETAGHFLCLIMGYDLIQFRKHHIKHHISYATPEDPDWAEYQWDEPSSSRIAFVASIAKDRCFWGALCRLLRRMFAENVRSKKAREPQEDAASLKSFDSRMISLPAIIIIQFILLGLFEYFSSWMFYFLFWALPLASVPMIIASIRMFGEHGGLERKQDSDLPHVLYSRTCAWHIKDGWSFLGFFEFLTFGAFNFHYHHEHHWFPSLPYHSLPRVHRLLMQEGHFDRYPDCKTESFTTSLKMFAINK